MKNDKIKLVALPCLCVDVFDGTDEIRPGGEALNFTAHASDFDNIEVTLLGVVGDDEYGKAVMTAVSRKKIRAEHVRTDQNHVTANNRTYLTEAGDRYYKPDSWNGEILEHIVLNEEETKIISSADVVFIHAQASCFTQVVELKKNFPFKLAVDFDVDRDFEGMERFAPYIDFFMISGKEELLPYMKAFSEKYDGLFNMTLAERGSVTYHHGIRYDAEAEKVETVVDTTGCGDSYHAGFVCSYMTEHDIEKAMKTGSKLAAETLLHFGGF